MTMAERVIMPGQRREPAGAHFRRMGEPHDVALEYAPDVPRATRSRFEVYRTDEVRMTSIRFAGGDWHWRLCDQAGGILVDSGGYCDEQACREAVAYLQDRAANAAFAPRP